MNMNEKLRKAGIAAAAALGLAVLLYLGGMLGQMLENYETWQSSGGLAGQAVIAPIDGDPAVCYRKAFTWSGLKGTGLLLLLGSGAAAYVKLHDRFDSNDLDPRGFSLSKTGTYGTASWMTQKELRAVLEVRSPGQADGIILGEMHGNAICLPKDTRLNRHIAVFGASGTMKSRAVIRPALFTAIKRGESAVITDPKGELYSDTAMLFQKMAMK